MVYTETNTPLLSLCAKAQAMTVSGVKCFVFSSSATVYAPKPESKINETDPLGPSNPYGQTKLMIEQILKVTATFIRIYTPTTPTNLSKMLHQEHAAAEKPHIVGQGCLSFFFC